MTHSTRNLQDLTKLPVRTVVVGDRMLPDVLVYTPHRGVVNIALKEEFHPFLFGSSTQLEKHLPVVLAEIRVLEEGAADYFFGQWAENHKES